MQLILPEGAVIYRLWDYTLGQYDGVDRGSKYKYVFVSDDDPATNPDTLGLMRNGDEHKAMAYRPPLALAATSINPASSFQANFELRDGITEAKLYVFLDAMRKSIHPDYNGVLVSGSSHLVAVATSGQYVEYVLEAIKDGLPVSLTGNGVVVTSAGLSAKRAAMNLTAVDLNAATWIGTVTKNQTGLYSDLSDQAASVSGAGYWAVSFADFVATSLTDMPDGHSLEFFLPYKLSSTGQSQRLAGFGHTGGSGFGATLQWATDDLVGGPKMRTFFRANNQGSIADQSTNSGYRTTATNAVYVKCTKTGTNWVVKTFIRATGGSALLLETTTVAIGSAVTFNTFFVGAWVRNTITNYSSGKFQIGDYKKGGVANSDVDILDLLNTGTLAA